MKTLKKSSLIAAVISGFIALALAGCSKPAAVNTPTPPSDKATAVMEPTLGNHVKGEIRFTKTAEGLHIVADIRGLQPGKHGFHIHEYGDCSAPNGTSAGGHFNPFGEPHGGPHAAKRHAGDLGNLTADSNGNAQLDVTDNHIALEGQTGIVGRAVIIHAGEDDLTSQPTGNAGARVACGVIGWAK